MPVKSFNNVPTATSPPAYMALILVSVTCSSPVISTVTEQVADTLPQVAVIVAEPLESGLTTPFVTVATDSALEVHTTLSVVSLGSTVATKVCVAESVKDNVVLSSEIPVAGTVSPEPPPLEPFLNIEINHVEY